MGLNMCQLRQETYLHYEPSFFGNKGQRRYKFPLFIVEPGRNILFLVNCDVWHIFQFVVYLQRRKSELASTSLLNCTITPNVRPLLNDNTQSQRGNKSMLPD